MPLYLASYIGAGTRADPWRPLGSEQPGWSAIRLLAKGERSIDARCLLWLPQAQIDARLEQFADALDESVTAPTRARLVSRLKLRPLASATLSEMIAELLLNPPVNGWNPLQPSMRTGRAEVILARKVIWRSPPAIRGGSVVTDDFNAALDTGKWEIGGGDWGAMETVSGGLRASNASTDSAIRLITPAIGADQYSQAALSFVASGSRLGGGSVRMAAGTNESSYQSAFAGHTNDLLLNETNINLVFTEVAFDGMPDAWVNGDVIRLEAEGSTLRIKQNGVEKLSGTDTTLTTGQPGFNIFTTTPANTILDNAEMGDLGGAPSLVYRPHPMRALLVR